MRIIKCVGYRGHKCGKTICATSNRQKRCPDCAVEANALAERVWRHESPVYKAWCKANKNAIRIRMKAWHRARRKANPEEARIRQRARYKVSPGSRREGSWRRQGITMENGDSLTYKKISERLKTGL